MRYVLVQFSTSNFHNFCSKRGIDRRAISLCILALPSSPVETDKMLKRNTYKFPEVTWTAAMKRVTDGVRSQYLQKYSILGVGI